MDERWGIYNNEEWEVRNFPESYMQQESSAWGIGLGKHEVLIGGVRLTYTMAFRKLIPNGAKDEAVK